MQIAGNPSFIHVFQLWNLHTKFHKHKWRQNKSTLDQSVPLFVGTYLVGRKTPGDLVDSGEQKF